MAGVRRTSPLRLVKLRPAAWQVLCLAAGSWTNSVSLQLVAQRHPRRAQLPLSNLGRPSRNPCPRHVWVRVRSMFLDHARHQCRHCSHCRGVVDLPLPVLAPACSAPTLRLMCLWHLWKHRNRVVFNGLAPPSPWCARTTETMSSSGGLDCPRTSVLMLTCGSLTSSPFDSRILLLPLSSPPCVGRCLPPSFVPC
jgi:hypothetical protein